MTILNNTPLLNENVLEQVLSDLKIKNGKIEISSDQTATIKASDTTINLIVKKSPHFEKYIYTDVLPEFVQIQKDKRILDPFNAFAKLYKVINNNEDLLIDDLTKNGFRKIKVCDYEHVKIAMEEIAKLHAMSLGLQVEDRKKFEGIRNFLKNDILLKAIKDEDSSKYVQTRLANVVKNPEGKLQEFQEYVVGLGKPDTFAVVVQGDSSLKNLLFKYQKDATVPAEMCFSDWQSARMGSPAFDIAYLLFTGTDSTFRKENFEYMLQVYYASLCTYLHMLGKNPATIFSYPDLQNHMKKYSVYVLYMLYYVSKVEKSKAQDKNDKVISEILEDLISYNYL